MPRAVLTIILLIALVVLPAIEAGSWFITRVQLEDDVATVATSAADEVARQPVTADTARTAFEFAQAELAHNGGGTIDPLTFRLEQDGTVSFTAHRTAPSLTLGHLDWTKDVMGVDVTVQGSPVG
jgi:hypothetical protein